MIILASKRHIKCLDELNDIERMEYISLLAKIRKAQRDVLGIEYVYYFYNEDTTQYFHTWMVPRYEWMRKFGHSVESLRPALKHARENINDRLHVENVVEAIQALRKELNKK